MWSGTAVVVGFAACVLLPISLGCQAAAAQDGKSAIWPTPEWQTASPEDEGMDSGELAKLVAFGKVRSFDSLLIVRHGRIVLDATYAPYSAEIPHAANSTTKAIVGSLVAMLNKDGTLDSLDHPLLDVFADRKVANLDARKQAITVQHLLNMASGFAWDEGAEGGKATSLDELGRSPDWVQYILDRPMAQAPGEVFYYNSGNPDLLSALITKLTGKRAADFANERLFVPLGIAPPFWRKNRQGLTIGAGGLMLKPRDMARIGYLYLRGGRWGEQQLLPPAWIEAVDHATVDMHLSFDPGFRYANLFWAIPDRGVFMAVGDHCQLIMVLPEPDIVAVVTARDYCPFRKMANDIAGAVKAETAVPPNPEAATRLAAAIDAIARETPTAAAAMPEMASSVSGKRYTFPDNALNIRSLTLYLADSDPHYELGLYLPNATGGYFRIDGPIGLDGVYRKTTPTEFGVPAAKGMWLNATTFAFDFQYVGLDEQRLVTLTFDHDSVTLRGRARDRREIAVASETWADWFSHSAGTVAAAVKRLF